TSLMQRFLARLGLGQPQELVPAIYQGSRDRTELASWAPLVLEAAEAGDAVALRIVDNGAGELAHAAAAVARTLGFQQRAVPVALSGGVLLASTAYRERVLAALGSLGIRADPVTVVREPAEGALRLAALSVRT